MPVRDEIVRFAKEHQKEALELLIELARIPAPSNHEEKRAAFCKAWLEKQGAASVYIDEALNVIWSVGDDGQKPLCVFMAHSDVVFPDTDELPLRTEDGRVYCPGVGDDTANLVALLMAAKFVAVNKLLPQDCGILFVVDSGEEGLGNLKGSRAIVEAFGDRIREFVTFDCYAEGMAVNTVGSRRYRIAVETEGGHSLMNFGRPNAIARLSAIIDTLYDYEVPKAGLNTYNVGVISGGTSVNTIAQHAEMLFEMRSDTRASLTEMDDHLMAVLDRAREAGVTVTAELIGDRPCAGEVDPDRQAALVQRAKAAIESAFGFVPTTGAASTDCNIPMAVGIPSVCVGCTQGKGMHTREEYIEIKSIEPGIATALLMVAEHL